MWANRILHALILISAWIVVPVQAVAGFVLGALVALTSGLVLVPIGLVWIVFFLGPLLGLSWLWGKTPLLRVPLACLGIPLALLANTYACLMPPMGEMQARVVRILQCETWPFTLQCRAFVAGRTAPDSQMAAQLIAVLLRLAREDRTIQQYLEMLAAQPTLRSPNGPDHAGVRAATLSFIIRQSRVPRDVFER